MFVLCAVNNHLMVGKKEPVTSGSVNAYRVRFEFSSDWDDLSRIAVFQSGGKEVSVPLDSSGECTIPWEVLTEPGRRLMVGVCGKQDEKLILTTIWADLGMVLRGAVSGGQAAQPVYQFGHGLKLTDNTVSVDTVDNFDGDNTLPITAAAVQESIGNIETILNTI